MDFSNRANRFIKLSEVSNDYIEKISHSTKNDEFYPKFHIAPRHGLVNDPNGLCQIDGIHHVFYQWFPLGPVHGVKYWYHVTTRDFINYEDNGVALNPEEDYEKHGCFSGSTFIEDGKVNVFYTGNKMVDGVGVQSQCLARLNLENDNLEKKGVVVESNFQDYTNEFRDPVVFKRDGTYNMLIGAQNKEKEGVMALYRGSVINSFEHCGYINISEEVKGYMIECPNYYEEDDRGIMIFSPQGVESPDKYTYRNVFSVVYSVGELIDLDNIRYKSSVVKELDKGFDFYAPQVYKDENNRRIMLGWFGNSKSEYPTDKNMWAHMMTLPREIKIRDNTIYQTVVDEMYNLKGESTKAEEKVQLKSKSFLLELDIEDDFEIKISNEKDHNIIFKGENNEFILDRGSMTALYAERFGSVRYAKRINYNKQRIEVWFDASAMEIFCDNGATVFTSRIFIEDISKIEFKNVSGELTYLDSINLNYNKKLL